MGGRHEILRECIACGGSITAEHGIGVEKLALVESLFGPADIEAMRRVRAAFDPLGLLNPGKVLPKASSSEERHSPPRAFRESKLATLSHDPQHLPAADANLRADG